MNGKDIINKRKAEGWKLDRINGNHHIMTKAGKPGMVTIL